ncbi:hypothetical protein [Chitinophaga arvensicola]|uniref:Uncharacterized protein n=1 Tax=Chitinophaga arvensicola TaxID=29529 RepID=A0A1I0QMN1_9BACT|nr:hypothetical protein [Chitinophaga arvensicola]SEW28020.1 hypothetical protein SAMN04488122_1551 [Chitinophaga arvensicola]
MTVPKSFVALCLMAICSAIACTEKSGGAHPAPCLVVSYDNGYHEATGSSSKLQITPDSSYLVTQNSSGVTTKKLSDALHDSLKPYLSSFPREAVKADSNVLNYSYRGAADAPFVGFTYIQENTGDSTVIYLDLPSENPSYIKAFQQQINQTISNNKIFN